MLSKQTTVEEQIYWSFFFFSALYSAADAANAKNQLQKCLPIVFLGFRKAVLGCTKV